MCQPSVVVFRASWCCSVFSYTDRTPLSLQCTRSIQKVLPRKRAWHWTKRSQRKAKYDTIAGALYFKACDDFNGSLLTGSLGEGLLVVGCVHCADDISCLLSIVRLLVYEFGSRDRNEGKWNMAEQILTNHLLEFSYLRSKQLIHLALFATV